MHEAPTYWGFERVDTCNLTLASEDAVPRIQTRNLQVTRQQPYSCAKAHPLIIVPICKQRQLQINRSRHI